MAFQQDPRHAKARQEFLRQAQTGATFKHSSYPSSHFEVLPSGQLHEMNTQRGMGTVQSMAPYLETGQVSFTSQAPGVLSESEYAAAQSAHGKVATMSGDEIRANLAASSPQTIEHIIPGNLASTAEATHEPMDPQTAAAKQAIVAAGGDPTPEAVRAHTLSGTSQRDTGTAKDDSDVTSPDSSLDAPAPAPVAPSATPSGAPAPAPVAPSATPSGAPGAGPAFPHDLAHSLGQMAGYALGSAGGPAGAVMGAAAGGLLAKAMTGKLAPGEVAKTAFATIGGAIAGKAGSMVGSALGGMFGGGDQAGGGGGDVGAGSGGGAVTVPGGGPGGEEEMVRLLREMSMNIKVLVNDGLFIKGNHGRTAGTI